MMNFIVMSESEYDKRDQTLNDIENPGKSLVFVTDEKSQIHTLRHAHTHIFSVCTHI